MIFGIAIEAGAKEYASLYPKERFRRVKTYSRYVNTAYDWEINWNGDEIWKSGDLVLFLFVPNSRSVIQLFYVCLCIFSIQ